MGRQDYHWGEMGNPARRCAEQSFSACRRTAYKVLEDNLVDGKRQVAFRLDARGDECLYEVLSLQQVEGRDWTADGYPSLEAFHRRAQAGWRDSPLPERLVPECPMTRLR